MATIEIIRLPNGDPEVRVSEMPDFMSEHLRLEEVEEFKQQVLDSYADLILAVSGDDEPTCADLDLEMGRLMRQAIDGPVN